MKKSFIIAFISTAFCIVLPLLAKSQSTGDLDLHNGFRTFNFNLTLAELKKVQHLKEVSSSNATGISVYTAKDAYKYEIYGYPLSAINLSFYKDRLYLIQLYIKGIDELPQAIPISIDVMDKVLQTYGQPTARDTSARTRVFKHSKYTFWQGRIVTLALEVPDMPPQQLTGAIRPASVWYFINNTVYDEMMKQSHSQEGL